MPDNTTPRPWRLDIGRTGHVDGIIGPDGYVITGCYYGEVQAPDDDNCILIVRAVNAHDALVNALDAVILYHTGGPWSEHHAAMWKEFTGKDEATTKVMCDTARAALRLARGE